MHEMSLAEGVIRILAREAEAQGFSKVRTVWVEVGELSHVAPEALAFCFTAAARDTVADGARLELLRVSGTAWCLDCDAEVMLPRRGEPCPQCGGYRLRVTGGEELRVKEVEVE